MKLSDYVIDFLAARGVTHFFGISGGAAVHLFDSVDKHPTAKYVCPQHEQSAASAADGYARATGRIGAAITTSGPGATNLLTGVCCSYYDSVPVFMITGQVATFRLKGDRAVRQVGFQETDVVSIYETVTKYVAQVREAKDIRFHMEKAYFLALEGRPGPVLIDLPDDLQRIEIEPDLLEGFVPPVTKGESLAPDIASLMSLLAKAERPVLVLGGGLNTPPVSRLKLLDFVGALGAPVLLTWAGLDMLPDGHPLRAGTFGVYGPRSGNFTIQNADLILTLGTRLSQNVTGGMLDAFAREATIVMVDVDPAEMSKFDGRGIDVDLRITSRAEAFLDGMLTQRAALLARASQADPAWLEKVRHWQEIFPLTGVAPGEPLGPCVDAYRFVRALSECLSENEIVVLDTGGTLTWASNGLRPKSGQNVFSAWNNTPMGYALPAAIGAAFSQRPVSCITGDGGLMLALGELATVIHHHLPIRVVVFNNHGHGIQKQTIETWLSGRYAGVHPESGLAFPDLTKVAEAMGFEVITISDESLMRQQLQQAYASPGPIFLNVEIHPNQKLYPVVKYGSPLEDQLPSLDRSVLENEMVVRSYEHKAGHDSNRGGAGV